MQRDSACQSSVESEFHYHGQVRWLPAVIYITAALSLGFLVRCIGI